MFGHLAIPKQRLDRFPSVETCFLRIEDVCFGTVTFTPNTTTFFRESDFEQVCWWT